MSDTEEHRRAPGSIANADRKSRELRELSR